MQVKDIVDEDFINYKKPSMFIITPFCTFKCDKEAGTNVCQNSSLVSLPTLEVETETICKRYIKNPITHAVVIGGLEPFNSPFDELKELIFTLREKYLCRDDIVIYTGYNKNEIEKSKIEWLEQYSNIIIKWGRFIPNQEKHFDEVLGVELASDNQYAERIS